jgi:hypothetical protein
MIRRRAGLNTGVVDVVVVQSNEELRPPTTFNDCGLGSMSWPQDHAQHGDEQAGREGGQTETG